MAASTSYFIRSAVPRKPALGPAFEGIWGFGGAVVFMMFLLPGNWPVSFKDKKGKPAVAAKWPKYLHRTISCSSDREVGCNSTFFFEALGAPAPGASSVSGAAGW